EGREVARRLPAADPPGPFLLHPGEESDEEEFVERGVGSVEHRPEQRIEFVEEMLPGHARAQVDIAEAVDREGHRAGLEILLQQPPVEFGRVLVGIQPVAAAEESQTRPCDLREDRKSTRLNSSHVSISYAVFCLTKKRQ